MLNAYINEHVNELVNVMIMPYSIIYEINNVVIPNLTTLDY